MNSTPRVALIGAGIAGLSCASQLQQAGFEVSLFDKRRGAGEPLAGRPLNGWLGRAPGLLP